MSMALRGGDDLRRISRELRHVGDGKEITKRMRKELRASAQPLVPLVRSSIRSIPSSRPYRAAGLRGRMSRATRLEVKTTGKQAGIAIRVDGRKMRGAGRLPSYVEGTRPRWRHPVYGNRGAWVQQPPRPYFYKIVKPAGLRSRFAVNRVLDQIDREIR